MTEMKTSLLDNKDFRILNELERNSRVSVSKIAKKLRLSKDGVNYRLKKLKERNIITRYFIDIDVSKLGLIFNKITIQFQNTAEDIEEEIFTYLKNHPKIGWVVRCSGRWDAVMVAFVKDLYEYNILLKEINEKYGEYIHSKEFVANPKYYVCNRKWLSPDEQPKISEIGGPITQEKVDNIDLKIIKLLAEDARIPILTIAKEIGISSTAIINRIKVLEKKRIILNYRLGLNLEKLQKEFCKSFIYLQNISEKQEKQLISYCLHHTNVTAVTHSIGPWDLELEMEVENFDQFYRIMNEIKNKFSTAIRNYEAIVITREYGIDYSTII